jgi:glycosyltransferase involved in cell wall biosynthesis
MNPNSTIRNIPLISVVVPVHNGAQWLGQTLDSLFAQTYPHFEIVLIDDASTDNLDKVLASFRDARLQVVHLKKNVGVSAARNLGIGMAKGSYIAFCDADDLCQPQRFERQLAFLEQHPETGLCGSAFTCFDTQDRETVKNPVSDEEIRKTLMWGNCFGLSTIMARGGILKVTRFDETLNVAEDYDLWMRLADSGVRLANLTESLIRYRLHPQQASRHKGAKLDQVTRKIRSLYCAGLLGDAQLQKQLRSGTIELEDMEAAAQKIALHTAHETRAFRFMLAWMYQQLPRHGVLPWLRWSKIQKRLQLHLDSHYRLNTALLALLPTRLARNYFDTLIKLKR